MDSSSTFSPEALWCGWSQSAGVSIVNEDVLWETITILPENLGIYWCF